MTLGSCDEDTHRGLQGSFSHTCGDMATSQRIKPVNTSVRYQTGISSYSLESPHFEECLACTNTVRSSWLCHTCTNSALPIEISNWKIYYLTLMVTLSSLVSTHTTTCYAYAKHLLDFGLSKEFLQGEDRTYVECVDC